MQIQIRQAGPSDALDVAQLLIDTRVIFMPYAPLAHAHDEVRGWVREILIPKGGVSVATTNDGLVGVIATERDNGVSWITQMAVKPALVNRSIGSQLLTQAMQNLPRPIRLYTFQANLGARRFYERFGFRAILFSDGEENEERCPDVLYEVQSENESATV